MLERRLARLLAWLALAPALLLTACGEAREEDGRLRVVATIAPVGALTQAVAGDAVRLDVLVRAGVDPHEYELRSADARAIADAGLILRNGLGADAFLDRALRDSKAPVITLTDGLPLRSADPHVWHDPTLAIAMVDTIVRALSTAAPAHAATFAANGRAYQERLRAVDGEVRAIIDAIPAAQRKLVTDHEAFAYFAARYGLTIVGTVIPGATTGVDPSAGDIAALVEAIRREGVRAIFSESSVDPKVARRVAAEAGVTVVDDLYGDSLGPPGSGADTVDGMLLSNARKIADALK